MPIAPSWRGSYDKPSRLTVTRCRLEFVTIDGVRLHDIERGTGPCVVLLHGGNPSKTKNLDQRGFVLA
jgi:hypothetical protein